MCCPCHVLQRQHRQGCSTTRALLGAVDLLLHVLQELDEGGDELSQSIAKVLAVARLLERPAEEAHESGRSGRGADGELQGLDGVALVAFAPDLSALVSKEDPEPQLLTSLICMSKYCDEHEPVLRCGCRIGE